jgi:hypothetical protein
LRMACPDAESGLEKATLARGSRASSPWRR